MPFKRIESRIDRSFKKRKKQKPDGDIITGGVTAIVGVGLLGLTADAVAGI